MVDKKAVAISIASFTSDKALQLSGVTNIYLTYILSIIAGAALIWGFRESIVSLYKQQSMKYTVCLLAFGLIVSISIGIVAHYTLIAKYHAKKNELAQLQEKQASSVLSQTGNLSPRRRVGINITADHAVILKPNMEGLDAGVEGKYGTFYTDTPTIK